MDQTELAVWGRGHKYELKQKVNPEGRVEMIDRSIVSLSLADWENKDLSME
jgi:hypothetical protein